MAKVLSSPEVVEIIYKLTLYELEIIFLDWLNGFLQYMYKAMDLNTFTPSLYVTDSQAFKQ